MSVASEDPQGADVADASQSRRNEFLNGCRAIAAVTMGTGAWGLVTGVAMVKSGLSMPEALGMSLLVYAGTAQLAALPLMAAGAPVGIVLFTALILNLRFMIFSAALVPLLKHLSRRSKMCLSYFSGDSVFIMFMQYNQNQPNRPNRHWWLAGAGGLSWFTWQVMSIFGIVLASQIPENWGLGLAGTLALLALAISVTNNRPTLFGGAITGLVAVTCAGWPLKLGLLLAVIAGIAAAMIFENLTEPRHESA